jgi:Putative transmembrane protein (PGPGW)
MPSGKLNYSVFTSRLDFLAIALRAFAHHISPMACERMVRVEVKETSPKPKRIEMFGRGFNLPQGRRQRIALGFALTLGGILGFLPILGFWMIPLGVFVLSLEFAYVRRLRRKMTVRFAKRRGKPI